ncbi:hypothetical protein [Bacillus massiliigorillae]|uniref:hypothetical protein n=1 Tax=Bacillus massiliigorillae TaxID=1243664 RepID=UPI0003A16F58|nr:hypothetical protein [Bacillus massiliigorillae]
MPYVLEKISLYENDTVKETNFVVKNDLFVSRDTSVNHIGFIRLQMDKYIIIAGETMIGNLAEYQENRIEYTTKIVLLGATTVLFPVDVTYEHQIKQALIDARKLLSEFPLDYVLVLRIPLSILRPSIVRFCRKHWIPGLIICVHDLEELQRIPITWIRDAVFPYKLVFIPHFLDWQEDQLLAWKQVFHDSNLAYVDDNIFAYEHLSKKLLKMLGIYPHRGILRTGGEVTYNVVHDDNQPCLLNRQAAYSDKIEFTVFKNQVIRAGSQISLPSKKGKELVIKIPGFFQ